MPEKTWHITKARHDKEASEHFQIRTDYFPDWESITLFYTAIHLIESRLADLNIHPDNHDDRSAHIKLHFKPIWDNYKFLSHLAWKARYKTDIRITERNRAEYHLSSIIKYFKK